ncbi:MAG: hypothetical protein Q4F49_04585 [Pseudoxanthomonas suwonensis]|nr:hypothetical protein [Pseudoxanthomonas suwonensis]
MRLSIRRIAIAALLACSLSLLAACTAPPTNGQAQDTPDAPAGTAPGTPAPATPAPPRDTDVALGQPGTVDTSCKIDADCAVKNVGNCCGYYPACVNVDSPTDPAAVQAECARTGMASVCGFPEISACHCSSGTCRAKSDRLTESLQ